MNECKSDPYTYSVIFFFPSLSTTPPTNLLFFFNWFTNQKEQKNWTSSESWVKLIPILPFFRLKHREKHGSLSVLASNPCFLEREVLGRCKMGWVDSSGCRLSGTAYTTRTPWRRTPWVSTLHVAAPLSPLIHKPGPALTTHTLIYTPFPQSCTFIQVFLDWIRRITCD